MTNFLIRIFIKNPDLVEHKDVRTSYGKMCGIVGIMCNIFLFLGKLFVGILSASVSITADAVNNLSDAFSSVINLFGFKMGSKPADSDHPYGHARYEYLSGLAVAVIIMVIGVELLSGSVKKIFSPTPTSYSTLTFVILTVSVLFKLWLSFFYKKIGKLISSNSLLASSADSRNDVIATLAVIASAVISKLTNVNLDGFAGVAVAAFILINGAGIVRDTLDPILGTPPDKELVKKLHDKIMSYPGVLGTHDMMIHDYGPGNQFSSVHVEVSANGDIVECHDVIDEIERACLDEFGIHLVIHMDPVVTDDAETTKMRIEIADLLYEIDSRLTIHDLRIVPSATSKKLLFDCVMPADQKSAEKLKAAVTSKVTAVYTDYTCIICFEQSYT